MMLQAVAGFDWDAGNLEKGQKHGVSVAKIEELFARHHAIRLDIWSTPFPRSGPGP